MALVEDFETTIKVIVVGNGGVGKSSMIRRFCTGEYTDTYKKTIGVDFLEKVQYIDSIAQDITFMVWDTAGQEEFDAITKQYYRNANGCVIAFSTVDRDSFDAVENWRKKVVAECGEIAMVLVQNKVDLIDQAVATSEEVETLAKKLKLKLYRTCVSENLNVDKVFEYLGEAYSNGETGGGQGGIATLEDIGTTKAGTSASEKEKTSEPDTPKPAAKEPKPAAPVASETNNESTSGAVGGPRDFGGGDDKPAKEAKASKPTDKKDEGVIKIVKPQPYTVHSSTSTFLSPQPSTLDPRPSDANRNPNPRS